MCECISPQKTSWTFRPCPTRRIDGCQICQTCVEEIECMGVPPMLTVRGFQWSSGHVSLTQWKPRCMPEGKSYCPYVPIREIDFPVDNFEICNVEMRPCTQMSYRGSPNMPIHHPEFLNMRAMALKRPSVPVKSSSTGSRHRSKPCLSCRWIQELCTRKWATTFVWYGITACHGKNTPSCRVFSFKGDWNIAPSRYMLG